MPFNKCTDSVQCPVCSVSHLPGESHSLQNGVYAGTCQHCGHFFKFKVTPVVRSEVKFTVNGKQFTVGNDWDPATNLNEFLRSTRVSMGTKYMCREGGCGICVVMVTRLNPGTHKKESVAVNSCLVPVFMCDGWNIVTIEGIGSQREGLHPLQSRLVQYNGSQCGFCSPAQIMNMYSLLQQNPKPSKQTVEDLYDGILCRCTGYRSILDTMKSFAADDVSSLDIEDLHVGVRHCNRTGEACEGVCGQYPNGKQGPPTGIHMVLKGAQWFTPTTSKELLAILDQCKDKRVRLVFGGTGTGVYKDIGPWMYDVLVSLHAVEELYTVQFGSSVQIGANVTLAHMMDLFNQHAKDPGFNYLEEFAQILKRVAHTNVRNAGSWAGNLMLKHAHPEFPSDVFVMLETVNAEVVVDWGAKMSVSKFLSYDMAAHVLTEVILPKVDPHSIVKVYKVSKRAQNSHSYVTGGFCAIVDKDDDFKVKGQPNLVYGGISREFVHATATEKFLNGKSLKSGGVLVGALMILQNEVKPEEDPLAGSVAYRRSLAMLLFYRFVLHVVGDKVLERYRSGATPLVRPLSSGIQTYDTKKQEWPLTEPLQKVEGKAQVTGEAVYTNDIPPSPGELFAAFAVTDVGNANIDKIDISAAKSMAGVEAVLLASDITGVNNTMPPPYGAEELLCTGQVLYAGQAVAIVVAVDLDTALTAAKAVKITYSNVLPPVLTVQEAVKKGMIFPKVADDIIVGDAEGAISKSPHCISGSVTCGTQYHYPMETQTCISIPREDGISVHTTSQWIDFSQKSVAQVLGVPTASVDLEVKRLGGAFGSKISRNFAISAGCALAAYKLNRPVRLAMDMHTNMKMVGKRFPYLINYEVGFTDEGLLQGVKVTYYCDCGCSANDCTLQEIMELGDNAYHCPNWHMVPIAVQTNTPCNTYCRAPGSTPGVFAMETMMEHVAQTLGKDPSTIKELNLYKKGQVTPGGMTLSYCSISDLMQQLEQSANVEARKQEVEEFNKANRWKKKGLSVVPLKYGVPWNTQNYGVNLAVFSQDGTVALSHGGIEVGQGINTKAAQVCAYELGIPVDMVHVKPTNTLTAAGSCFTGSSVTSELVCQSVVNACADLNARMAPVRAKLKNPTWLKVVQACYAQGIDLATHSWFKPHSDTFFQYNSYGVTCTEVELDVLTGEFQVTRVDMLFDCGESINPFLDIGQVEGAFVMGLGYWLLEESIYDTKSGHYLTDGTWNYKCPSSQDIPIDFRINLLKDAPNPIGILRSKACGEPPLCMSCSALFALKHAVQSARQESGSKGYFNLDCPATVEVLQRACLTKLTDAEAC